MAKNNSKKEIVQKHMDEIKEWISQGVPMAQIAKKIGVSKTTLYRHVEEPAVGTGLDAVKKIRQPAVDKLEATMMQSACGYTREVTKYAKVKHAKYSKSGKKLEEWEEMVEYKETQYFPPDTTAGIFLLKNWGEYMNEPRAMEIRKREVELKEKQSWTAEG